MQHINIRKLFEEIIRFLPSVKNDGKKTDWSLQFNGTFEKLEFLRPELMPTYLNLLKEEVSNKNFFIRKGFFPFGNKDIGFFKVYFKNYFVDSENPPCFVMLAFNIFGFTGFTVVQFKKISKERFLELRESDESALFKYCATCEKYTNIKLQVCSRCAKICYCSVDCQKADWKNHKLICK